MGMLEDASNELERLPPEAKTHPLVLALRLDIYQEAEKWDAVEAVAQFMAEGDPGNPEWPLRWAFAVRKTRSFEEALEILERAKDRFPDEPTIRFNLGCYLCRLGRKEEAQAEVKRAIQLDQRFKILVIEDPDLEDLW